MLEITTILSNFFVFRFYVIWVQNALTFLQTSKCSTKKCLASLKKLQCCTALHWACNSIALKYSNSENCWLINWSELKGLKFTIVSNFFTYFHFASFGSKMLTGFCRLASAVVKYEAVQRNAKLAWKKYFIVALYKRFFKVASKAHIRFKIYNGLVIDK